MKINSIIFATSNQSKLDEARNILGVRIKGTALKIEEIQSLDPVKVATTKARDYFERLKKPIVVEDVSLSFNALRGLPGTYINDFLQLLGNEGLLGLLEGNNDRTAAALTIVVYKDKLRGEHIFKGEMIGKISQEIKGKNGFGWDQIFIPEGSTKSLAEMSLEEKNNYSMRAKAFKAFSKWLSS